MMVVQWLPLIGPKVNLEEEATVEVAAVGLEVVLLAAAALVAAELVEAVVVVEVVLVAIQVGQASVPAPNPRSVVAAAKALQEVQKVVLPVLANHMPQSLDDLVRELVQELLQELVQGLVPGLDRGRCPGLVAKQADMDPAVLHQKQGNSRKQKRMKIWKTSYSLITMRPFVEFQRCQRNLHMDKRFTMRFKAQLILQFVTLSHPWR